MGESAWSQREDDWSRASGKFAATGDAQVRYNVYRGSTPGVAPGETVALATGTLAGTANTLDSLRRYKIRVAAVATKLGTGAAAAEVASFEFTAIASVRSGGTVDFALGTTETIVSGAAFVGATLVFSSTGANNLTLTFSIAGGLTVASRIVADLKFVEVLGT
jgi:hypothetical protein